MRSLMPWHTCMPPATCCPRLTLKEQSRGVEEGKEPGRGGPRAGSDQTIPSRHFLQSLRTLGPVSRSQPPVTPVCCQAGRAALPPRGPGRRDGTGRPAAGGSPRDRTPQLAGDRLLWVGKLPAGTLFTPPRSSPGPTYMVLAKGGGG